MQQIFKQVVFFCCLQSFVICHPSRNKVIFIVYLCNNYEIDASKRPALFPLRKCYLEVRNIEKSFTRQKARALVNNCLFHIRLFSPNWTCTV